jgi:hypothetical protein
MNRQRAIGQLGRFLGAGLVSLIGILSCNTTDQSPAETRDPAEVQPVALEGSAPALWSDSVSFYALAGKDRRAEIFFQDSLGQRGRRLLRFDVDKESLLSYPDGRRFQNGDSVLITIRIATGGTLAFDFEPSGLEFKLSRPAELEVDYSLTAAADASNEDDLAVWMQEAPNQLFQRLTSEVDINDDEIKAKVPGFSRYAIAW